MSRTWTGAEPPPLPPVTGAGWLRVVLRGTVLGVVIFGGLALLLLLRLIERPIFGLRRPVTPWITQAVCRSAFPIMGIGFGSRGVPMSHHGIVVANHSSWLDIFALNARKRIYYVSKSEVAGWPGIGWLARATGTVFITRDPRQATAQKQLFEARLQAGHKLLFFPEGTSTDGLQVLPFNATLFAALYGAALRDAVWVQPVTVIYTAPEGADPRFYGWWGHQDFGPHLLKLLAAPRHGGVEVVYHPPLRVADHPNRKTLARAAEAAVRAPMEARSQPPVMAP